MTSTHTRWFPTGSVKAVPAGGAKHFLGRETHANLRLGFASRPGMRLRGPTVILSVGAHFWCCVSQPKALVAFKVKKGFPEGVRQLSEGAVEGQVVVVLAGETKRLFQSKSGRVLLVRGEGGAVSVVFPSLQLVACAEESLTLSGMLHGACRRGGVGSLHKDGKQDLGADA